MYTIPGTNIQIPMSFASGGINTSYGPMSGDFGESMAMYSDPAFSSLNYPGVGFNITDPTHAMATIPGVGGLDRSLAYTLQDGNWSLNPESLNQWTPYQTSWLDMLRPAAFVGLGALGGELAGLGAGTIGGEGSMLAGSQIGAMGELGAGAGSVIPGASLDYATYGLGGNALGAGSMASTGASSFPLTGAASALGTGVEAAPWYSSLLSSLGVGGSSAGTAGGFGLGQGLGLAGSLAQLIGGLYGANQARGMANLAGQATPWITGGGQAQAAQQLQQALGGNVSGLPGFQQAQQAAMTNAGRGMAASGRYGGGSYAPGMATAASNQYMNYLNMLGNMAGVGAQPNYNAMQAGIGGQVSGMSTALQGGLGTLGSLMSLFGGR